MPRSPTLARPRPSQSWTQEDDNMLREARSRGFNWFQIARTHFPSKSANACRKRHERLQEKEHADSYGAGPGLERLAVAYNDVRARIWAPLAEALGETDWRLVEKKAMEAGLKNLQGAMRGHRSHPSPDSGIMMLDEGYGSAPAELWPTASTAAADPAASAGYASYRPQQQPQPVPGAYYRPMPPMGYAAQASPAVGYATSPGNPYARPVSQMRAGQQTRAPTIGFITEHAQQQQQQQQQQQHQQSQAGSTMYGPPGGWRH